MEKEKNKMMENGKWKKKKNYKNHKVYFPNRFSSSLVAS